MFVAHAAARSTSGLVILLQLRDLVDLCDLFYHLRSFEYLWSVLSPEAMLMPLACAAAEDCDGVCELCCGGDHIHAHGLYSQLRPC